MKSVFKNPLFYLSIILVIAAGFTVFDIVKGRTFQEPTSGPTEQGVITEPITEGDEMQTKSGSLTIQKKLISKTTLSPLLQISDNQDISITSDGICLSGECKRYWSQVGNLGDWTSLNQLIVFSVECHKDCDNEDVVFKVGNYSSIKKILADDPTDFKEGIKLEDSTRVSKGRYTIDLKFMGNHIDSDEIVSAEFIKNMEGTWSDNKGKYNRKMSIANTLGDKVIEFGISTETDKSRDLEAGDEIRFIVAWPTIN